ncbi:MAG: acyl-CoA synthetase (AMP-forming)/AMP-acid ligase II [Halioglobus sp.]|jgi:acyl-CoA synthetase (AMP-forming)/AMP-acid ligase II
MPREASLNSTHLHQLIAQQAQIKPEGIALWWQGEATDYATLNDRIQNIAGRLVEDGDKGERVAILAWNRPEFVELIYAVPAAGQILVPLNARLAPAEWLNQLQSSGVKTLFGDATLLQPLLVHPQFPQDVRIIALDTDFENWIVTGNTASLPTTQSTDPAWILYTSGSTGRPKGAVLTHHSFLAGLRSAALGRPVEPTDKYYYPFPLFHVAAHNVLLQHQYGAAVVLAKSFDASETLSACRELGITSMSLAPTMIAMLMEHPDFCAQDLATVRTIGYGASAMPQTLLKKLLQDTDVGLCQSYGMTELSGSVSFLTVTDHQIAASQKPQLLQSVGQPLATAQLKLVDEQGRECDPGAVGEIVVKAQQCLDRYWNDELATEIALADGWLLTGDIGRFDNEGYLYIVDRKKDMIISGGENIASREVEEVLRQHPAVSDCAVIGLPDAQWGERCCAVLRLNTTVSDQELQEHCYSLLGKFKSPRYWFRTDELPLNAAGKVDKPLLRKLYEKDD